MQAQLLIETLIETLKARRGCNWELLSEAPADAIRPWSRSETVEGSAGSDWELLSDALVDAIRPWSRSETVDS